MKTVFVVFLLLPMATGLPSYACCGPSDEERCQHIIYCEENEMINIISGHYGFKNSNYSCSPYCYFFSNYCDCLRDFNYKVQWDLKVFCNGKKRCNFYTPKPYNKVCYNELTDYVGVKDTATYDRYMYSRIDHECLTAKTALSTSQVYTNRSRIKSTTQDNSRPQPSTESDIVKDASGGTEAVLNAIEINNTKFVNCNQDTADTGVIAGSVVGCILLVILIFIVVVFIFKRKSIRTFIDSHSKGGPRVSNPVYEAPSDGYNNVAFKNDNSPSVNVVKPDDYNHLHGIKNDNSMTTGNTYNHLGQMMGDYNHLHANNNSIHVDECSDAACNHLTKVKKTHNSDYNHLNGLKGPDNISEKVANANYSHLGGWTVDYNHLHGGKNEIHEADYKSEISNDDYNHIGGITNEDVVDNYHHLGNVNAHVVNGDD